MASIKHKVAFLIFCSLFAHLSALNVGPQSTGHDTGLSLGSKCSRKCESAYCILPPLLRYGKYCGLMYSGCPGEKPCDELDRCCMVHDQCVAVKQNDYLNVNCNNNFLKCITAFKKSGRPSFHGNQCSTTEVVDVITVVMEAALLAGKNIGHHR